MNLNKTVEVTYIKGTSRKIVWIYQEEKFKNSYITYKRKFFNEGMFDYGISDKITNITVKNNQLASFDVVNYLEEKNESRNTFCKNIGRDLWKISSFLDTIFYVDKASEKCFDKDLMSIENIYFRILKIYLFWANFFLGVIKIDTYYDKVFLRKVLVYRQNKKENKLVNLEQVNQFLLCCNRLDFLPELIPEILKFVSYI